MEWATIVAMLALLQYVYFSMKVGWARNKYGVKAPATSGHEEFDKHFRVHQNTLEQLVLFLPSLYAFAYYASAPWAAALGLVYILGRFIYAAAYIKSPATRARGMALSTLPVWALALGALAAATLHLLGIM